MAKISFHQQVVINDEESIRRVKEIMNKKVVVENTSDSIVRTVSLEELKELHKKWNIK